MHQALAIKLMISFQLFLSEIGRLQSSLSESEKVRSELEYQRNQVEQKAKEVDKREIQLISEQERVLH